MAGVGQERSGRQGAREEALPKEAVPHATSRTDSSSLAADLQALDLKELASVLKLLHKSLQVKRDGDQTEGADLTQRAQQLQHHSNSQPGTHARSQLASQ